MILNQPLIEFIRNNEWVFAKTYATTWPHEYIVQEKVESKLFLEFANHIDTYGYEGIFYKMKLIYYDYDGFTYWHMENIINRCLTTETYHKRKLENRLPENI